MKFQQLSPSYIAKLTTFLQEEEISILEEWLRATKIKNDDPFYDEIIKNGKQTIRLIGTYIQNQSEEMIIRLTKKIALQRLEANVNIGEFVFNINQGRSIVNTVLSQSSLSNEEKMEGMLLVNSMFDLFLYHAVKEYTTMKDKIISEKNQFIQEMHNDRLTVLGQIASSFAHEFRNPLTSIKGFIKLLESKYKDIDAQNQHYFSILHSEMDSLQEKVTQFLFLSKSKGLDDETQSFNLTETIDSLIEFMYPRFVDEAINVKSPKHDDIYITGVKEQIKQVLLNIVINAVEGLSNVHKSKVITIDLTVENEEVHVSICNNGPKIPDHLLENIFEPFITTKDLGFGLGLSVCKQIVQKHNGSINVQSDIERTTFKIVLPITK